MRPQIVLYTRVGCHLCDEAHDLLASRGLRPRLVDIDADPALREQFHEWVPVIEINGQVRLRGIVNAVLLDRELLHAASGEGH
ncbi:MAG: glutaredoxin family protein [Pirellulales bacterium]